MVWLVVCRAVQGIGGGGIIQLVQITISDIVSLEEYAYYLIYNVFFIAHLHTADEVNTADLLVRPGVSRGK